MKEHKMSGGRFVRTEKEPTPVKEWLEEGKRLFGKNIMKWRYVCPMCGKRYSVQEFVDAGGDGPNSAYQECIGRPRHAGPPDKEKGNPDGCNWCAYGFFGCAGKGRIVLAEDGTAVEVFHFDGEEENDA